MGEGIDASVFLSPTTTSSMGEHLKTPGDSSNDKTAEDISREAENQTAPFSTETFRKTRPHIVGPDEPESPFPIYLQGAVQVGFGRGGKDLGCPTGKLHLISFRSSADFRQQICPRTHFNH